MEARGQEGPPLHPALKPMAFMLGTWRGEGEGGFPTIQSFKYGEEIRLWHVGKPVMAYTQKTWKAQSGEPMHAESGYFRPKPDGSIEVIIAQSTGLAEVQKGTFDPDQQTIELKSALVGNGSKVGQSKYYPFLKLLLVLSTLQTAEVVDIARRFSVDGNQLKYSVAMGTHTHELQPHLQAVLKRVIT